MYDLSYRLQSLYNVVQPPNGHTPIMANRNFCISPPKSEHPFCSICSHERTNEKEGRDSPHQMAAY